MIEDDTHLPGEVAKIVKRHLRCDYATLAIQLCPFLQAAIHLLQQAKGPLMEIANYTSPYQKLLLFGMILHGSALLPILVLLLQRVFLVASPAHLSTVSQNCHNSTS